LKAIQSVGLLFHGNVSNNAEGKLPQGGWVEFIYTVLGKCIVLVIEVKAWPLTQDYAAQVMAELEGRVNSN
jgi:hypothetical protein